MESHLQDTISQRLFEEEMAPNSVDDMHEHMPEHMPEQTVQQPTINASPVCLVDAGITVDQIKIAIESQKSDISIETLTNGLAIDIMRMVDTEGLAFGVVSNKKDAFRRMMNVRNSRLQLVCLFQRSTSILALKSPSNESNIDRISARC